MSDPYPAAESTTDSAKASPPRLIDRLLSLVRREPEDREGIMTVLDAARARNLIDSDSYSMLKGALAVSEQTVMDVMVPRARMDLLDVSESIADLLPDIIETAHSRFPVFEESRDNIIGIAMTKDLLRHLIDPSLTLRDLVRPAVFIPETKRLNVLLQEFRSKRNHIAVVIDEHGGITGLVTLEDILEQIVGEIEDEYDVAGEQTIFSDGAQAWRVLATTEIQAFNTALNTNLPDGDYDTVGGWLAHALGRIPHRGDFCLHKDLRVEVMRADSRRALWLRVKRRLLNDNTTPAKVD
ncbi:MAG: transporter associated domain-containing protein [Burkholderiaceae bacterium]|jgi:magnesium and cobalt transporter|nr:transporter associated domain-containing protein [Burkholderiaceae bacterium]